jgi:hypothetical protein
MFRARYDSTLLPVLRGVKRRHSVVLVIHLGKDLGKARIGNLVPRIRSWRRAIHICRP